MTSTTLHTKRLDYKPRRPDIFKTSIKNLAYETKSSIKSELTIAQLQEFFPSSIQKTPIRFIRQKQVQKQAKEQTKKITTPLSELRVGVILSGGQAPGGHNVIAGLYDGLKQLNTQSILYGFLMGTEGLVKNKHIELTDTLIDRYRNTGGFNIIGSGRTKIETPAQFESALQTVQECKLNGLVVIGGDDSNTNAALLSEYFIAHECSCVVVGVPKTIDGDLKNKYIESSFGFDTATKTYSELIGNIARDASSARKYWHFIRLMGRAASHITLECALSTHPNIALISEELLNNGSSLKEIINTITQVIIDRAQNGDYFGLVLIPEGLIEFIPDIRSLITEINALLADTRIKNFTTTEKRKSFVQKNLPSKLKEVFASLPSHISTQLLQDRDPHGNIVLSQIETEKMIIEMVNVELNSRKQKNKTVSPEIPFSHVAHFFGYEGRSAFPSNFDSNYCYSLGLCACTLIYNSLSGYMATIRGLANSTKQWEAWGIPLHSMMTIETRKGAKTPVIKKALVELNDKAFRYFERNRKSWALSSDYAVPGAIQYSDDEIGNTITHTLALEFPSPSHKKTQNHTKK